MQGNDYDRINLYLKNKLSDTERKAVEQEMENDEAFAKAVKKQQETLGYITLMGQRERRAEIKNILATAPEQKTLRGKRNFLLAIAATVALLFIAGYYLLQKPNYTKLADAYFESYSVAERNRGNENATIKEQAVNFYHEKNYQKSLPLLEQLYESDSEARLMGGIAHYELKQFDRALEQFKLLIDSKDFFHLDGALWYAALTELKMGNLDVARKYLGSISDKGTYNKNAKKLREALE